MYDLDATLERLRAELSENAAAGDITACDILHHAIATVELAIHIATSGGNE